MTHPSIPESSTPTESPGQGCGFSAPMFGAPYPDALCVDGTLWDLDSDDGAGLTKGGEIPCPRCATADWLADLRATAEGEIPQPQDRLTPAEVWERAVLTALDLAPSAAREALRAMEPFELLDRPGRIDTPARPFEDDASLVWRRWPWKAPCLSAHAQIAITPDSPSS